MKGSAKHTLFGDWNRDIKDKDVHDSGTAGCLMKIYEIEKLSISETSQSDLTYELFYDEEKEKLRLRISYDPSFIQIENPSEGLFETLKEKAYIYPVTLKLYAASLHVLKKHDIALFDYIKDWTSDLNISTLYIVEHNYGEVVFLNEIINNLRGATTSTIYVDSDHNIKLGVGLEPALGAYILRSEARTVKHARSLIDEVCWKHRPPNWLTRLQNVASTPLEQRCIPLESKSKSAAKIS